MSWLFLLARKSIGRPLVDVGDDLARLRAETDSVSRNLAVHSDRHDEWRLLTRSERGDIDRGTGAGEERTVGSEYECCRDELILQRPISRVLDDAGNRQTTAVSCVL
jgi:hypothetical protein